MKNATFLIATIVSAGIAVGCSSNSSDSAGNAVIGIDSENWQAREFSCSDQSLTWTDINDWYYQLQFMDYFELSRTEYDMLVIDPEPDEPLNSNVIERMRCDGNGEKKLVAYLAIGKAENFREYWQDDWSVGNPEWIASPNGEFEGEFLVRYWNEDWKSIVMGEPDSRLDRIIAAGFDGVVLDGVDSYRERLGENPQAVEDLAEFISEIKEYAIAQSGNNDFGIFVQNTEELISNSAVDWTSQLNGIIKLSPFYAPVDNIVPTDLRSWYDLHLSQWVANGKQVFSVDYTSNPDNTVNAYTEARSRSYIPLTVTSFGLDNLTTPEGFEPD